MYSALAPLVGAVITLMNGINSRFAGFVGYIVASLVIHIVGLVLVSVILLARREIPKPGRLPFYYYLGGFVGVGTVFASNCAFTALGASLAVALALLGQTLFSLTADATGLLGRRKYPLSARRLPGIALALAGVAIMAGSWRSWSPAFFAALAAGACPGLSFILNSELGRKKGIFRSTRVNYIVGLATTLLIVAAIRPPLEPAARAIAKAGPILVIGGGSLGVLIVTAMNFIFPRVSAFSATILLFSGQALAGLLIDFAVAGNLDLRKLAGTVVLIAGLAIDSLLSRRSRQ
jgi:bacterial/archaeal transporter family-2 protein